MIEILREDTGIGLEDIYNELFRSGGWLNTDESFRKIQSLYQEERIAHIWMNITDHIAFQTVSDWLKANDFHFDSLYLSNIPDWLHNSDDRRKQMMSLNRAINRVINKHTQVIHASEYFHESTGMPQRVYQGSPYDPEKVMTTLR